MDTQPTLSLDLLTHIGTFMNPNENRNYYYDHSLKGYDYYYYYHSFTYDERMYLAGALRDKDLLQYYLQRDGRHNACTSIALAGNLPFLRRLRRESCPWDKGPSLRSHFNISKCPPSAAASRGDLEMLK